MGDSLALFITFSAYGNRLHGDERGSVDRSNNTPGSPGLALNAALAGWERNHMRGRPMSFHEPARTTIERSFGETCANRGWLLAAVHCRTNHVHCIVGSDEPIERVAHDLKSYATRALRSKGLVASSQPVWARHASMRQLTNERAIEQVWQYVMDGQGTDLRGTMAALLHRQEHPDG